MPHMPEIIAHRGLPRERTENTLESFALALARGADALELDVHATRDGVVVVHHDPALAAPHTHVLAERDYASVAALELRGGGRAPTLASVLALAASASTYVEIKASGIEDAVLAVLDEAPGPVAVHAFDHRVAAAMAERAPRLRRGVLLSSYLLDLPHVLRGARAQDLWQHWSMIDEPLVGAAHDAGCRVIAWTVNDAEAAARLARLGVDGLCTDVCDDLRAALAARGFAARARSSP